MHSSLTRLQATFGFFTSVCFFVGILVSLSTLYFPPSPSATAAVKTVQLVKGRPNYYAKTKHQEYAFIKFDMDADLSSLFNWNTKQVFTYLSISYPGGPTSKGVNYDENTSVIWDKIIESKRKSKLRLRKERSKYNVHDITGRFDERNATISLHYNIQPHVGALVWGEIPLVGDEIKFQFPSIKPKTRSN